MTELTTAERKAQGKAARAKAPLESHADIGPDAGRDPVGLIIGQAATRVPELVPIRHGRMLASPFTFYRGAALPMAADLSRTPSSGLRVQLCGDAHLSNFGVFGAPDRRLVFDLNDFDETLPGPFEWDVKRFAASLAVAGRDIGLSAKDRKTLVRHGVGAYRTGMAGLHREEAARRLVRPPRHRGRPRAAGPEGQRRAGHPHPQGHGQGAHPRQHAGAQEADHRGRRPPQVRQQPAAGGADRGARPTRSAPTRSWRGWPPSCASTAARSAPTASTWSSSSGSSGSPARWSGSAAWAPAPGCSCSRPTAGANRCSCRPRRPSARCSPTTAARASTATRASAWSPGSTSCRRPATSSSGWQHVEAGLDGQSRDFYVRQLRDWKYSAEIEHDGAVRPHRSTPSCAAGPSPARTPARATGSRSRATSASPTSSTGPWSPTPRRYADRTEQDHAALAQAVTDGRIEAVTGI